MRTRMALQGVLTLILMVSSNIGTAEESTTAVAVTDDTFDCIRSMTAVRGFYVDNLLGDLDATVAVANSPTGGEYPPGSLVQLVPGEVMVKHSKGFSPATKDWEFFELDVSADGSSIKKRGFVDVVNQFDGNCFACHIQAEAQWDMICETDHGCEEIPLTREMVMVIQKTDPRCDDNEQLTADDIETLKKLQAAFQPPA
jgi:hypothetical protein